MVASKEICVFPPAALSCPPPSKCALENLFTEKLPLDETYGVSGEELDEFLKMSEELEGAEVRGLNKQEREEFEKLVRKIS